MADEIAYKIIVESDLADKSVGQLKQDFKDLTDQLNKTKIGTDEYKKTLSSLGVVKGGIQELKQQIQALNPEKTAAAFAKVGSTVANGFAAGQAAVALFGGESENLTKTLVKVQAATALASGIQGLSGMGKAFDTLSLAIKSNPIYLIAAVITGIGVALYALRDKIKVVGDAFNVLGDAFSWIVEKSKELLASVGLYDLAADRAVEANKRIKKSLDDLTDSNDNYVKLLKAQGKETYQIEKDNLESRLELVSKQIANRKGLTEKEFEDAKKLQAELYIDLAQLNTNHNKAISDKNKEREEERIKELKRIQKYESDANELHLKLLKGASDIEKEENQNKLDALLGQDDEQVKKELENKKKNDKLLLDQEKYVADLKIQIQQQSVTAIAGLTNTLFENAIMGAKGNAKREYDIKKQQFKFNQALSATEAVISTISAVQKNYAQGGLAIGSALNIAQIAIGTANVAAILAKKYPPFEGGGGDSSTPSAGGGGGSEAPSFQQPKTTGINKDSSGDFKSFQNTQPQKVYVLETDITNTQKNVAKIEQNASY